MHFLNRIVRFAGILILLSACDGMETALVQVTAETLTTPTFTPEPSATPLPATEVPRQTPLVLSVWIPDTLAPQNNPEVNTILTNQINAFHTSQANITVELRVKRASGTGGIVDTFLSASVVAPNVLPALTLVRREDLFTLMQVGLIFPLNGRISTAITDDLYPAAMQLGQQRSGLYGLPYALDILHIAFQPPTANFSRFTSALQSERRLVLPAGNVNGLSDIFLVQYLSAGGTLEGGTLSPVNLEALGAVLEFYEQAGINGVIDSSVLNYPSPQDYRAGLVDGRITAAVLTSSMYLDLLETDEEWGAITIPLASATPMTAVDGWLWVVTTGDSDRQAAAMQFLEWMLNPQRQRAYTQAVGLLPSSQTALRTWDNQEYAAFAGNLLNNAIVPLANSEINLTARAIQSAILSVISGERTAAEARRDIAQQLGM
jgi:maltose-binding protein MalE